ncbi:DNA repair protein RecO [Ethanoligenens harbinense YUAN-3]|uniref:DNA repair protein RecO n=2 Tax=Ethanoligenens harbinense TaxID=253239 RepID=E6U538_ETHHY|nr:DNA repair protein RecO [Ethanoligenens harbinense YUAN-3]
MSCVERVADKMGTQAVTDGLVIRDYNVGEADRFLTLLTRKYGAIRASARGARRIKSGVSTGTQLLCHADFTLFKGREKYIIDEATPLTLFMGIRAELEKLALAQYFCELEDFLAPKEEEAELFLRLILNALALLEAGKHPSMQIKAAFEMRLLAISGYMPDLVACAGCGTYEADGMVLLPRSGVFLCASCAAREQVSPGECTALSRGALAALRHTAYADFARLFSFSLPEQTLKSFAAASEQYLLATLERSFQTLEFYHSLFVDR